MLKVEVFLENEQIVESFENAEVKFSKSKLKVLLNRIDNELPDIKERLENELVSLLEEMIYEEWG